MNKRLSTLLLALLLALALTLPAGAAFSDISDSETALAAATLQGFGVADGTGGSSFAPDEPLTRAQACKLVVGVMGLSSQVNTYARKTLFSDVPPSAWYNGYVNLAYAEGIINGYGDGTFGPDDPITYGQLATVALRLLGYTSAEIGSVWPMDYTAFADELGLCGSLTLRAEQTLTRGQAAIVLANALRENTAAGKPYYQTISTVRSTLECVLLDPSASSGGSTELLAVYALDGSGVQYYAQANAQSDALCGCVGVLLFDGSGRAIGFVPESTDYLDLKIGSASATTLTAANGTGYRISSGARVIASGEVYPYASTGYLQLNSQSGRSVRLFYDDTGAVSYLYLTGGASASSSAVVAGSASLSALTRSLGLSGDDYSITKNGASASGSSLAANDVAYFDAATATIRVSDYRVSGFIEAASPSVSAATSITVAGCTLEVLESAWDTLSGLQLGKRVTLLLTDDCKVAAVSTRLSAEMLGVLSTDGRSVTLAGSGVTLSASKLSCEESALGSLVRVSASSASTLSCTKLSTGGYGRLDLAAQTLGSASLAPGCAVYEWAGSGYAEPLALSDIDWTDTISSSNVSYAHTNSAGEIDLLLLKNVTGNVYQYGKLSLYTEQDGINLGSGTMSAYNTAATLTNSEGTTGKYLCSAASSGGYAGIALGRYSSAYSRVVSVQTLSRVSADASDFYLSTGDWYAETGGTVYRIADAVQLHVTDTDLWLSGADGLASILADGYTLTLYYDRAPSEGGQVRIIRADRTA